jgi:hypothetical protein
MRLQAKLISSVGWMSLMLIACGSNEDSPTEKVGGTQAQDSSGGVARPSSTRGGQTSTVAGTATGGVGTISPASGATSSSGGAPLGTGGEKSSTGGTTNRGGAPASGAGATSNRGGAAASGAGATSNTGGVKTSAGASNSGTFSTKSSAGGASTSTSVNTAVPNAPSAACERAGLASSGRVLQVGAGKAYASLAAVQKVVQPGDVVEVDGNATYPAVRVETAGTAERPVLYRGVVVNGKRPVISGGSNTVHFKGSHVVFDGFEVTAGSERCVFHEADDITLCRTVVHDCPRHGILGADTGSGSLILSQIEVYGAGGEIEGESLKHPIYIATDPEAYPNSTFRLEFSYLHDNNGGNAVKSRARRTEVYFNWIESSPRMYYTIEAIGSEEFDPHPRQDSDIVGNVLVHLASSGMRFGGDGSGTSRGRVRFVNNTVVVGPEFDEYTPAIRFYDEIDAFDASNNVFVRLGGGAFRIIRDEASWVRGSPTIGGSKNWVPTAASNVPSTWTSTLTGSTPDLTMATTLTGLNVSLAPNSPLRAAGTASIAGTAGMEIAMPLTTLTYQPSATRPTSFDVKRPRATEVAPSIGAQGAQ